MIQNHLIAFLRAHKVAQGVVHYQPGMPVSGIIKGRLLGFERVLSGESSSVRVTLELRYLGADSTQVMWSKEYAIQQDARGSELQDIAAAFGLALENIYSQFIKDLAGVQ